MISWLFKNKKEVEPAIQYKVVQKTIKLEKFQHPVKLLLITNETVIEYLPTELYKPECNANLITGEVTSIYSSNERKFITTIDDYNGIKFCPYTNPNSHGKILIIGNKAFNIDHVISYELLSAVKTGEEEVIYKALEKI